eukprot:scaffold21694_cov33-Attheya_sp.AAC.1
MTSGPQMCLPREFVQRKWCLCNAGEDGSGGMGVTTVGSGSGGNGGGGGISGGVRGGIVGGVGVEGCERGAHGFDSNAMMVCANQVSKRSSFFENVGEAVLDFVMSSRLTNAFACEEVVTWSCSRREESSISNCGVNKWRAEEKWISTSSEGAKLWNRSIIEGIPGKRRNRRIVEREILHERCRVLLQNVERMGE